MSSTSLVAQSSNQTQVQQSQSSQQVATSQQSQAVSSNTGTPQSRQVSQPSQSPAPRTPQSQLLQQASPARSTPGKWEHPRMAEVLERKRLTTFNTSSANRVIANTICLLITVLAPGPFSRVSVIPTAEKVAQADDHRLPRAISYDLRTWLTWPSYILQIILIANITIALLPLLRKKDNMEDIPLTPQQRLLLDLPPMSRPSTPQEEAACITPPRYPRSTPNSADSLFVNARGTPLSEREFARDGFLSSTPPSAGFAGLRSTSSQFATSPLGRHSPDILSQRDSSRRESGRRDSFGRRNPGRREDSPVSGADMSVFSTPIGKSNRASVGLNSKWLYEKGKGSPTGFMASGWGSGSVFT